MSENNIIQKSISWSLLSEVAAKFITPITSMLLARILTPNDFGVIAICNMVVTFTDIIKDAGFGKYMIQRDFCDKKTREDYASVAFWSNLLLSIFLFCFIILNQDIIASYLGNKEYGIAISISCIQLMITSISSIQTNLLRREFEYKKLFVVRILISAVPLLITVPLAFVTKSFWALIIGNLIGALCNAVTLTYLSDWKPRAFYSVKILKEMFSFSFWSLCEGLAHWLIFWIDTFIAAQVFSDYYIGLYKNSANMVMSIMGMVSASMSPVLLSVLSRLKNKEDLFYCTFLNIQKLMLYLIIPMGLGLFCYRKIITLILFGARWSEASDIVGMWGLMMMCSLIFYSFTAELYKAKGIPKVLFLFQCSYLAFLIPVCMLTTRYGFWNFVYGRCFSILEFVIMSLVVLKVTFKVNIKETLRNMINPLIASLAIPISYLMMSTLMITDLLEFVGMMISSFSYFIVVHMLFVKDINNLRSLIKNEEMV